MTRRTFVRAYRLHAIITTAVLTIAAWPAADAVADIPQPPPLVVSGGGGVDLSDLVGTAKKTACTPGGDTSDYDSWSGALRALVNNDPLRPEIQYVWNTYDGEVQASALAWVPDTGCARDVKVTSQVTDTSPARNCEPVVQSREFSAYGHEHWELDGEDVLVGVNPNAFQLPVTYYGDDGSTFDASARVNEYVPAGSSPDEFSPYCVRSSSVVTVKTDGYYRNNLDTYVWFACEQDEYQITATPTGPRIDYVKTVPC